MSKEENNPGGIALGFFSFIATTIFVYQASEENAIAAIIAGLIAGAIGTRIGDLLWKLLVFLISILIIVFFTGLRNILFSTLAG